jgi:hypothetical protein
VDESGEPLPLLNASQLTSGYAHFNFALHDSADGPTTQRVGASELDPWKRLRVDESRPIWPFGAMTVTH